MNYRTIILSSVILLSVSTAATAEFFAEGSALEGNSYLGIHIGAVKFEEDDDFDFNVVGGAVRVGHEFGRYFAIEGQAGRTTDTKEGQVDLGIDYFLGLYAKGSLFLWDPSARVYGLVGVTRAKFKAEAFNESNSNTDTELGYGIGIELYGNARNGLNLELMRYMDGSEDDVDYTVDSFNIGYIYRF